MDSKITPRVEPSFQSIQRCCKLGSFADSSISTARLAIDAFENSKVLQKYCADNDVHMIISSDTLRNCRRNQWYASLDLIKLFPKKELNWLGKIINFFKPKPHEAVIIRAYGNDGSMARTKLAEFINSIKDERVLSSYISKRKHNPLAMEKCRTCGWDVDYRQF